MEENINKHLSKFQLGNYVKYKGEVVQINNELLAKHLLNQLDEPIEPIEICKEWLYRFGFRNIDYHFFTILNKGIYVSSLNIETSGNWLLGSPKLAHLSFEIKYIHEILNAVAHLNETSIGVNIDTEIEILGSKLFNLSPLQQQIEILKKQIELYHYEYGSYDESYKSQQIELLAILEDLKLKKA